MHLEKEHKFYVIFLITAAIWLSLIIIAPLLAQTSMKKTSLFIYFSFAPFCHQLAERSFFLGGYPLAVCSRCFGIYCGLLVGFLVFPLIRRFNFHEVIDRRYLIAGCIPMSLDVSFMMFHFYPSNIWTRFSSGMCFGIILAFYVLPGFYQMIVIIFRQGLLKKLVKR
jgi:uncharacterized membrane protein